VQGPLNNWSNWLKASPGRDTGIFCLFLMINAHKLQRIKWHLEIFAIMPKNVLNLRGHIILMKKCLLEEISIYFVYSITMIDEM
jgi:hypothetical protein